MQSKSTSGVHLWLVLSRATKAVEARALESIEATGLCDFAVLESLLHKGPLPVNTIGKKLLLTSGSITTAVDRLEARGLVRRAEDPNDRRVRLVELTDDGRELIKPAFAQHKRDLDRVASALPADERTTLVNLLRARGTSAESER